MEWLQQDRISTALSYWSSLGNSKEEAVWYLSGGVKNAIEKYQNTQTLTEAERMGKSFKHVFGDRVVLDTTATNTAENFRNFFEFISKLDLNLKIDIVIVTSAFHKVRAEKFFYGFFSDNIFPQWVLAPLECPTCARDELFHMKNVQADIKKAKLPELAFDF